MEGGGHDKEVGSFKFNASIQKSIPYLGPKWQQNGQKFLIKTAEKPYPLGPYIPI